MGKRHFTSPMRGERSLRTFHLDQDITTYEVA
jgi:hypothetical protein